MPNFISISDFSIPQLTQLIQNANHIMDHPEQYAEAMKGKILASLFYEASTRTRFSFEAAMLRLGGSVIGFSEASSSSVAKGESVKDTIRTVAAYADIAAMRHFLEGAPLLASEFSPIPVINGGDGGHLHPTQTLTDLLTIYRTKGSLENNHLVLCGDLKNGRTVHSLVQAMSQFKGNTFCFVAPKELAIPEYIKDYLEEDQYTESESLEESLPKADILYMTRIQRERFDNPMEYERLKNVFILGIDKMILAKPDMIVLHPLPRVNEIAEEVDNDPRAKYFLQAKCGMYVRMALIIELLKDKASKEKGDSSVKNTTGLKCSNPKCISNHEPVKNAGYYVNKHGQYTCPYCDKPAVAIPDRMPAPMPA